MTLVFGRDFFVGGGVDIFDFVSMGREVSRVIIEFEFKFEEIELVGVVDGGVAVVEMLGIVEI